MTQAYRDALLEYVALKQLAGDLREQEHGRGGPGSLRSEVSARLDQAQENLAEFIKRRLT